MMAGSRNTTLSAASHYLEDVSRAEEELDSDLDDADDIPAHIREARYAELRKNAETMKQRMDNKHGEYTEVNDTKEFLNITTTNPRVVCHFYHPEMKRCNIIDKHLSLIAPKNFQTRFVRFNVTNSGFLVEKLKLQVLPAVIAFNDGVVVPKGRIIGFEELGNTDNFTTMQLMERLFETGVLTDPAAAKNSTSLSSVARVKGSAEDWD